MTNPQAAAASKEGAKNRVPSFIKVSGSVMQVRFRLLNQMDTDRIRIEESMLKGDEFARRGLFQEAIACWQQAIANVQDPSPSLLIKLAHAFQEVGDIERTEKLLLTAIDKAPGSSQAYILLGQVYRAKNSYDQAAEQFKKALRIEATADVFVLLGCSEMRLGSLEEARQCFEKAIKCDPTFEEAYFNLGVTYIHYPGEKQLIRARDLFHRAVTLNPEYALGHRELGRTLTELDNLVEAMEQLNVALKLSPNDYRTYMYLGNLYIRMGESESADEALTTAMTLGPESEAVLALAIFYKLHRLDEEARALFVKAVRVHPDKAVAEIEFAKFLSCMGETESAKDHLREALRIEPDEAEAQTLLRAMGVVYKPH